MTNSAELVVRIGQINSKLPEASSKGFKSEEAMHLLYELENVIDALLVADTKEFLAKEVTR